MLISENVGFHMKMKLLVHNFLCGTCDITYITITWSCTLIHTHNNELTLMLNMWPFSNLDEMHIIYILIQNDFTPQCKSLKLCMVVYHFTYLYACVLYVISIVTYVCKGTSFTMHVWFIFCIKNPIQDVLWENLVF